MATTAATALFATTTAALTRLIAVTWLTRFTGLSMLLRFVRFSRCRVIVVRSCLLLLSIVSYGSVGAICGLCT